MWPGNAAAVEAFLSVAGQWRTATAFTATGARIVWIGLDYAAVRAGLEAEAIAVTPLLWRRLRVMENAAAEVLNGQ